MKQLAIPGDVHDLTTDRMIEDLETLAIKAETESLTDAETEYQRALRKEVRERTQD